MAKPAAAEPELVGPDAGEMVVVQIEVDQFREPVEVPRFVFLEKIKACI